MNKFIRAVFITLVLMGAGCSSEEAFEAQNNNENMYQDQTTVGQKSEALKFHLETAATGLRDAVKDATGPELAPYQGYVEFAQMTLPQAVAIANEDGLPELAQSITDLDQQLTLIVANSATADELKTGVLTVADALAGL